MSDVVRIPKIDMRRVATAGTAGREPVAWTWRGPKGGFIADDKKPAWPAIPLFASPPPAVAQEPVAVKELEWRRSGWVEGFAKPDGLGIWYSIQPDKPVRGPGEPPFTCNAIWGAPGQNERECLGLNFQSLDEAKAAAQSDYENRIRSALSSPPREPAPKVVNNWQPIAMADKEGPRMMLGVVRGGKLEEIHIGAYSFAYNEDEESCWWSEQADDMIVPSLWAPIPALSATATEGE